MLEITSYAVATEAVYFGFRFEPMSLKLMLILILICIATMLVIVYLVPVAAYALYQHLCIL